ncbi:protein-disulfide reductase DsbD domain-containing protein [Chitinophaga sp. 22321]|uniref:Thiol:disulfide interchange protein DsbD N-terminal domain-containing protein n=1 Tax=Chitinophaga hostae TaxID=2831022 RepID=A0ABS5JA06_9BACT|nr:protein-disulfide reductase DsbD domain-containing protein [Chitinophaga hostae]MBS0032048.1 hypothetical protein [Chitinophaga hostae]
MKFKLLTISIVIGCLAASNANGQIHWQYSSQKMSGNVFKIHITAIIESGWHLYSQVQPPEAIATPPLVKFSENPAVAFHGKVKEIGQRELYENKEVGIKSYRYKSAVDFVQVVQIKDEAATKINGSISYMACTDEQCMPTRTQQFSIPLK